MGRTWGAVAVVAVLGSASAVAVAAAGGDGGATSAQAPVRYEQSDLYIEYNATAGDAGLQLGLDAEDWRQFTLLDSKGRRLAEVDAKGRLRSFGLTELFFEAAEPSFKELPFREFKKRIPEGTYRFRGVDVDGRRVIGSDRLTHVIPAAPKVTFPTRGARVDPNSFKVTWESVTRPAGVRIVSYQVIVRQGDRELSMYLPSTATSATIPPEFVRSGTALTGELLARERSGNQTITEFPAFRSA